MTHDDALAEKVGPLCSPCANGDCLDHDQDDQLCPCHCVAEATLEYQGSVFQKDQRVGNSEELVGVIYVSQKDFSFLTVLND